MAVERSWFQIIMYSLAQVPVEMVAYYTSTTLAAFYANVLDLPLFTISVAEFVAGLLIMFVQLGVGYLSDRCQGLGCIKGRRRPFILLSTPMMAFGAMALLYPIPGLSQGGLTLWLYGFQVLYQCARETLSVPNNALGVEFSQDPTIRVRLYVAKTICGALGAVAGSYGVTGLIEDYGQRDGTKYYGFVSCLALLVIVWAMTFSIPEDPNLAVKKPMPLIPGFRSCAENRNFVRLMWVGSVLPLLNQLPGVYVFVLANVLRQAPGEAFKYGVVVYIAGSVVASALATPAIHKFGRLVTIKIGLVVMVIHAGLMAISMQTLSMAWFYIAMTVFGLSLGATNVVLNTCVADVVDIDEVLTGRRRESTYSSLFNLPVNVMSIAGKAIPLVLIYSAGFKPGYIPKGQPHAGAGVPQPAAVIRVLKGIVIGLPLSAALVCLFLFEFYRVDERINARVATLSQLLRRDSQRQGDAIEPAEHANAGAGAGAGVRSDDDHNDSLPGVSRFPASGRRQLEAAKPAVGDPSATVPLLSFAEPSPATTFVPGQAANVAHSAPSSPHSHQRLPSAETLRARSNMLGALDGNDPSALVFALRTSVNAVDATFAGGDATCSSGSLRRRRRHRGRRPPALSAGDGGFIPHPWDSESADPAALGGAGATSTIPRTQSFDDSEDLAGVDQPLGSLELPAGSHNRPSSVGPGSQSGAAMETPTSGGPGAATQGLLGTEAAPDSSSINNSDDLAPSMEDEGGELERLLPLYLSRRDLRMLAAGWRKRFLAKFVVSGCLWLIAVALAIAASADLLHEANSSTRMANQIAFFTLILAAVAALCLTYEVVRLRAIWAVFGLPKSAVRYWLLSRHVRTKAVVRVVSYLLGPGDATDMSLEDLDSDDILAMRSSEVCTQPADGSGVDGVAGPHDAFASEAVRPSARARSAGGSSIGGGGRGGGVHWNGRSRRSATFACCGRSPSSRPLLSEIADLSDDEIDLYPANRGVGLAEHHRRGAASEPSVLYDAPASGDSEGPIVLPGLPPHLRRQVSAEDIDRSTAPKWLSVHAIVRMLSFHGIFIAYFLSVLLIVKLRPEWFKLTHGPAAGSPTG